MTKPMEYTAAFLEKAHEAFDTARLNSDNDHQGAAIKRAFYAACAALRSCAW